MAGVRGPSWTRAETLDLLDIWGQQAVQAALGESHRNWEVFDDISRRMAARGHEKSTTECRNKTKNLRKAYKRALALNKKSGNCTVTCPFYHELDRILLGDPSVKTRRLSQSLRRVVLPNQKATSTLSEKPALSVLGERGVSGTEVLAAPAETVFTIQFEQMSEDNFLQAELGDDSLLSSTDGCSQNIPICIIEDSDNTNIDTECSEEPHSSKQVRNKDVSVTALSTLRKPEDKVMSQAGPRREGNTTTGQAKTKQNLSRPTTDGGHRDSSAIHPDIPLSDLSPKSRIAVRNFKRRRVNTLHTLGEQILRQSAREHQDFMELIRASNYIYLEDQRQCRELEKQSTDCIASLFRESIGVLRDISSKLAPRQSRGLSVSPCTELQRKPRIFQEGMQGLDNITQDLSIQSHAQELSKSDAGKNIDVDGTSNNMAVSTENKAIEHTPVRLVSSHCSLISRDTEFKKPEINIGTLNTNLTAYECESEDSSSYSEEWVRGSQESSPLTVKTDASWNVQCSRSPFTSVGEKPVIQSNDYAKVSSHTCHVSHTTKVMTMKEILFGEVIKNDYGMVIRDKHGEVFVDCVDRVVDTDHDVHVPDTGEHYLDFSKSLNNIPEYTKIVDKSDSVNTKQIENQEIDKDLSSKTELYDAGLGVNPRMQPLIKKIKMEDMTTYTGLPPVESHSHVSEKMLTTEILKKTPKGMGHVESVVQDKLGENKTDVKSVMKRSAVSVGKQEEFPRVKHEIKKRLRYSPADY